MWDWRSAAPPTKKAKKDTNVAAASPAKKETFTCLECLEECYKTKKTTNIKYAKICRKDVSSVQRHKERWHVEKNKCTFVPTHSKQIKLIVDRYNTDIDDEDRDVLSNKPAASEGRKYYPGPDPPEHVPTPCGPTPTSLQTSASSSIPLQSTLFDFAKQQTPSTVTDDTQTILAAIHDLSLNVKGIKTRQKTICEAAFEDPKKSQTLQALRSSKTIDDAISFCEAYEFTTKELKKGSYAVRFVSTHFC